MTGGPSDFFGSEILAKSDLFESERRRDFFGVAKKKQRDFFRLRKRTKVFLGMLKKVVIFSGRQILKL